jgi:hypothetical protein
MIRRQLQHALDVSQRTRDVFEGAQTQIDELLAQQQRLVGARCRFTLERLLEHVGDLFVPPLGQQAAYHALAGRFVAGRNFQDALADVDRQVVTGSGIVQ